MPTYALSMLGFRLFGEPASGALFSQGIRGFWTTVMILDGEFCTEKAFGKVIMNIKGEFDVKLSPMDTYAKASGEIKLGRMSLDKTFHGPLSAISKGEMLSAMTRVKGSAGYVAIEQVTGTLNGKNGTFVFQHFGTMDNGKDRLILEVVPDSGEYGLIGLTGKMEIKIEGGKHFYSFDFELK